MIRAAARALLIAICAAGPATVAGGAAPPPSSKYVFVPDTNQEVGIRRGDLVMVGKLDIDGNFLPKSWIHLDRDRDDPKLKSITIINDCAHTPAGPAPRPCYEYRSGRLIKGVIDTKGNFVPDADSTVIAFGDYHYGPKAIPIWNLPGRFVGRSEAGKK
jgi:hypothetical protein